MVAKWEIIDDKWILVPDMDTLPNREATMYGLFKASLKCLAEIAHKEGLTLDAWIKSHEREEDSNARLLERFKWLESIKRDVNVWVLNGDWGDRWADRKAAADAQLQEDWGNNAAALPWRQIKKALPGSPKEHPACETEAEEEKFDLSRTVPLRAGEDLSKATLRQKGRLGRVLNI